MDIQNPLAGAENVTSSAGAASQQLDSQIQEFSPTEQQEINRSDLAHELSQFSLEPAQHIESSDDSLGGIVIPPLRTYADAHNVRCTISRILIDYYLMYIIFRLPLNILITPRNCSPSLSHKRLTCLLSLKRPIPPQKRRFQLHRAPINLAIVLAQRLPMHRP